MDLKPEEISKIIKAQIKQYDQKLKQDETGTIILVGDRISPSASGLESCMANELVEFENGEYGMALNLEEDSVSIVILGSEWACTKAASFVARGALFPFLLAKS